MGTTGVKYDDWGWHVGGVFPADQPPENGMVHMAAYLAWIVRRGWHRAEYFEPKHIEAIERRAPGAALQAMEWSDGKLVDEVMSDEARRFSDYYYYADGYLADWERQFSAFGPYAVPDIPTTHERIEPILERRYEQWVRRGRPSAWKATAGDRATRLLRNILPYGILFATIGTVGVLGAVLGLRGFPWPLVQLAIVAGVIVLMARRGLL